MNLFPEHKWYDRLWTAYFIGLVVVMFLMLITAAIT